MNPPPSPAVAQQADPAAAQSVFAQQGLDQGKDAGGQQATQQIMAKLQELEAWAGDMKNMVETFDPSLVPFLQQIAKVAVQFGTAVQQKAQRSGMARGSSVVQSTPPQNPGGPPPNPNGM